MQTNPTFFLPKKNQSTLPYCLLKFLISALRLFSTFFKIRNHIN